MKTVKDVLREIRQSGSEHFHIIAARICGDDSSLYDQVVAVWRQAADTRDERFDRAISLAEAAEKGSENETAN
jgi:hypothetical protein